MGRPSSSSTGGQISLSLGRTYQVSTHPLYCRNGIHFLCIAAAATATTVTPTPTTTSRLGAASSRCVATAGRHCIVPSSRVAPTVSSERSTDDDDDDCCSCRWSRTSGRNIGCGFVVTSRHDYNDFYYIRQFSSSIHQQCDRTATVLNTVVHACMHATDDNEMDSHASPLSIHNSRRYIHT